MKRFKPLHHSRLRQRAAKQKSSGGMSVLHKTNIDQGSSPFDVGLRLGRWWLHGSVSSRLFAGIGATLLLVGSAYIGYMAPLSALTWPGRLIVTLLLLLLLLEVGVSIERRLQTRSEASLAAAFVRTDTLSVSPGPPPIALREELRELEGRAGIAQQIESVQLDATAPNVTSSVEESFRENQASAKRRARELYFSIQDMAVRKELIRQRRGCRKLYEASLQRNMTKAQTRLTLAEQAANGGEPWLLAGCFGALGALTSMSLGFGGWSVLIGLFAAQNSIFRVRWQRSAEISAAQAELDKERKTAALYPDWFNAIEEASGTRDESFDRECASFPNQPHV
jgi:hypothetical protein